MAFGSSSTGKHKHNSRKNSKCTCHCNDLCKAVLPLESDWEDVLTSDALANESVRM